MKKAKNIPASRKEAKAIGSKVYLGKVCSKGHNEGRLVSSCECVVCHRERVSKDYHISRPVYVPDIVEETPAPTPMFDFTPSKPKRIRRKPGWSSIDRA